jgi:transposase
MRKKTLELRKKVINEYLLHNQSVEQIAVSCNLSWTTVYYLLRASNIRMKKRGRKPNQKQKRIKIKEDFSEIMRFLYIFLKLKRRHLARMFQCSTSTIDKRLKKYNIKRK